ncbi:MAG TPA: pitrilysin family protein, partial [Rhodothermales bacterium]|nr:pitrilysin family protein [Rhodothermales bacterium]
MSSNRALLIFALLAASLGACTSSRQAAPPPPLQSDAALPPNAPVMPAAPSMQPAADTTLLPVDPNVRTGILPNGVRYYIRHNEEPRDRAELRLAVDAGTAMEDPGQYGAAHFVEHMLFNGTEHFPKQSLVNFLERTGMKFGADVNAYTALDETVYQLTIPTDSTDIVTKSFEVLEDWAAHATLSPEEVAKERGVIVEEWRARRENVQGRILEQRYPFLLRGSSYADLLFAATPDVIRSTTSEELRQFYETWYRPELMAVVAVGDFDVDRYEQLIKEHFSNLTDPADPTARPDLSVPARTAPSYLVIADEEYPYTTVEINYIRPSEEDSTVAQYRKHLIDGLANGMLNQRFSDITHQPNPPFLGASVHSYDVVRPTQVYGLFAQVQEDSILTGLEALATEAARARRYGFTTTELARRKSEVLRAYEKAYAERENTNSAGYAREYVSNFLEGEPIPGIAYEYELVQKLLPQITVQDVNRRADRLLADSNRAVIVTMPEKDGLAKPTEEQLAAVFQQVEQKQVEPYVDTVTDEPLVSSVPAPAAVTSTKTTPELGVTEITLTNGVHVV